MNTIDNLSDFIADLISQSQRDRGQYANGTIPAAQGPEVTRILRDDYGQRYLPIDYSPNGWIIRTHNFSWNLRILCRK